MDLLGTTFSVNGKVHDLILGVYDLAQLSAEDIIRIKRGGLNNLNFVGVFRAKWIGLFKQKRHLNKQMTFCFMHEVNIFQFLEY